MLTPAAASPFVFSFLVLFICRSLALFPPLFTPLRCPSRGGPEQYLLLQTPLMFTEQMQQDVIMVLKFPSNSPVTHVAANTQPGLTSPAIITVTANRLFAVNKWHGLTGVSMHDPGIFIYLVSTLIVLSKMGTLQIVCSMTLRLRVSSAGKVLLPEIHFHISPVHLFPRHFVSNFPEPRIDSSRLFRMDIDSGDRWLCLLNSSIKCDTCSSQREVSRPPLYISLSLHKTLFTQRPSRPLKKH